LPDANIIMGGSDTNRTINISPASQQLGNAIITVTVNDGSLSASSAFPLSVTGTAQETWTFTNFGSASTTSGLGASTADPDGDGLVNFLEYAFGANPNLADAANYAPFLERSGGELLFTYPKVVATLSYSVEQSSTLLVDSWSPLTITETDNANGTCSVNVPASGGKQFLHLKVSTP
jgi:predicted lipoprotein with Yx(FWY)xxD motif